MAYQPHKDPLLTGVGPFKQERDPCNSSRVRIEGTGENTHSLPEKASGLDAGPQPTWFQPRRFGTTWKCSLKLSHKIDFLSIHPVIVS